MTATFQKKRRRLWGSIPFPLSYLLSRRFALSLFCLHSLLGSNLLIGLVEVVPRLEVKVVHIAEAVTDGCPIVVAHC